jgi:hypothetical protein
MTAKTINAIPTSVAGFIVSPHIWLQLFLARGFVPAQLFAGCEGFAAMIALQRLILFFCFHVIIPPFSKKS